MNNIISDNDHFFAKKHFEDGLIHFENKDFINAEINFSKSLEIIPDRLSTITNLIATLIKLNKFVDASKYLQNAMRKYEKDEILYLNQGILNLKLKNLTAAIQSFDNSIKINNNYSEAYNNLGFIYDKLNESNLSLYNYNAAIRINPIYIEALYNRGNLFNKLKKYDLAIKDFELAITINKNYEDLLASYIAAKMQVCDWTNYETDLKDLTILLDKKIVTAPFRVLSLFDDPKLHHSVAKAYSESEIPIDDSLGDLNFPIKNSKIRIAYFSADFHNHATSFLMIDIFELHDHNQFEFIAFSFGPNINDGMRFRLKNAFDQFIDVSNMSDHEVTILARKLNINIAIDLKGYTDGQRAGIFSKRCAPIQVNFLGYPGTMSAPFYDYIIADSIIIPNNMEVFYSEKIIFLPNTYQPNDSKKVISFNNLKKQDHGLPINAFVFCSFNNTYKILPEIFDIWLNILKAVPNSVLWLIKDNNIAVSNLRMYAERNGVRSNRLIFANRLKLDEHLARHKFADLFLDTFPYNAHTTASDALWAGLPVLTCQGKSFASRVASSLLVATNLSEFITNTFYEYQTKAIHFAMNSKIIDDAKISLKKNKNMYPLFNSLSFTRDLEKAYFQMYSRYLSSEKPANIYI
jgi:predicted O-linked N-acetylglucosamine transferase (SPINDLY family)